MAQAARVAFAVGGKVLAAVQICVSVLTRTRAPADELVTFSHSNTVMVAWLPPFVNAAARRMSPLACAALPKLLPLHWTVPCSSQMAMLLSPLLDLFSAPKKTSECWVLGSR